MLTEIQRKFAAEIVAALRGGGTLINERTDPESWSIWRLNGGKAVPDAVMRELEEFGLIEPSRDGIFGESQTCRLRGKPQSEADFLRRRVGERFAVARSGSKAAATAVQMGYRPVTKGQVDKAKAEYQFLASL